MNEIYLYKKNSNCKKNIFLGLSYPSTYYYGMSVLGYLSLFKEFDKNEEVAAQRIFLNSKSLAFSPKDLDLLGFSCIFEIDILQILKILKKLGFKAESNNRKRKTPLIFAGGPVVTTNPEPFADFFDFLIIGDGEGIADEIVKVYKANRKKSKLEILKALSKIEGIYVPSLYKVKYDKENIVTFYPISDDIPRFINKRTIISEKCLYSPIISENTFYPNTVFIELGRGCPFECSFCAAHWQNNPTRYYDLKYIKKAIKKATKYAKKLVFIGAMISGHPNFDEICLYLKKLKEKKEFQVEFSSLSFEYPSEIVPQIISDKSIALSIECGSEELRKKINKNLSDKKIFEIIDFYTQKGIEKINLYFIIGLPNETEKDISKYIDFSKKLANKFPNVKFNHIISSFIPKPHTPLEKSKRKSNFIINEYIENIKNGFDKAGISYVLPMLQNDNFNALISLGDRRLSHFIKHIFEKNIPLKNFFKEYNYFSKRENKKPEAEFIIPHYSKYIYKEKKENAILPWEFIKK